VVADRLAINLFKPRDSEGNLIIKKSQHAAVGAEFRYSFRTMPTPDSKRQGVVEGRKKVNDADDLTGSGAGDEWSGTSIVVGGDNGRRVIKKAD